MAHGQERDRSRAEVVTWQWVVFTAIVAIWAVAIQFVHTWKEVEMAKLLPEDMIREAGKQ